MRYKIVNPSTETDESVDNARGKGTYNNGNDFCIIYSMIITKKETVFECQPTVGRQLMLLFITIRMFLGIVSWGRGSLGAQFLVLFVHIPGI